MFDHAPYFISLGMQWHKEKALASWGTQYGHFSFLIRRSCELTLKKKCHVTQQRFYDFLWRVHLVTVILLKGTIGNLFGKEFFCKSNMREKKGSFNNMKGIYIFPRFDFIKDNSSMVWVSPHFFHTVVTKQPSFLVLKLIFCMLICTLHDSLYL